MMNIQDSVDVTSIMVDETVASVQMDTLTILTVPVSDFLMLLSVLSAQSFADISIFHPQAIKTPDKAIF